MKICWTMEMESNKIYHVASGCCPNKYTKFLGSYEVRAMTVFPQNFVHASRTTRTRHMLGFIDFCFLFLANFQT